MAFESGLDPAMPARVQVAFAYLEHVRSRLQPCCHPPGELTQREAAVLNVALRTLTLYLTGEESFAEPTPPPPPPRAVNAA